MDIPTRIIIALSIMGGVAAVAIPSLYVYAKRRKADRLRRRGVKSYNRPGGQALKR